MKPEHRWAARSAAGLAAGARWFCAYSLLAAPLSLSQAGSGVLSTAIGLASLAVALFAAYLALRLEIDRELFGRLAEDASDDDRVLAELDSGLILTFGGAKSQRIRSLAQRLSGLRRWALRAAATSFLQTLLLAAQWISLSLR